MTATLTGYGGVGEIGGNAFLVDTGKTRALLDFGVSFKRFGNAFSEFLAPRKVSGLGDWLLADVAPDIAGLYRQDHRSRVGARPEERGVDAVFVSHPHMDHLGMVPLVRPDVEIVSSPTAFGVAKAIEETGGSFGLQDFTTYFEDYRFYENKKGGLSRVSRKTDAPVERPWRTADRIDLDGVTAHLMPVDHSIHGARGILLEGDANVAYSGDLRLHGRHKKWTEDWVARCAGVDTLLVEGTNMADPDAERKPLLDDDHRLIDEFRALEDESEAGVESFIADGIRDETGYCFIAYPQRDLDRLQSFLAAARKTGRRLCVTPKQAYLLDTLAGLGADGGLDEAVPTTRDPDVRVYVPRKGWGLVERDDLWSDGRNLIDADYAGWERKYLDHPNRVLRADIAADPGRYLVFADLWNLTELHEFQPGGGTYVYSKTEPFDEAMVEDRKRLLWWLQRWRLRTVAAHVSGHARPDELLWMADEIGARTTVPIHTEDAAYYAKRLAAAGVAATSPRRGQALPIG